MLVLGFPARGPRRRRPRCGWAGGSQSADPPHLSDLTWRDLYTGLSKGFKTFTVDFAESAVA